ncbi:MAG: BlaI/MecI/CopY family transcriptional regulator [Planctomycetota bacterium]
MTDRIGELGASELEVLKVLWDVGPSTVRDVLTHLHERGRRLAYTTVLTFLSRLEQKGYVTSNKSEPAYVYKAKVSRERVTRSRVRSLLHELYDGAAGALVLQLMQSERLSPEELLELQALLNRLEDDTEQGQ